MKTIQSYLAKISPVFADVDGVPLAMLVLVILITSSFLLFYLFKGVQVGFQLRSAVKGLQGLQKDEAEPEEAGAILRWAPFTHLWSEYKDTLHILKVASSGTTTHQEVRATMPAEAFFTRDILVDGRLFDDFTRHIPGVLTGLGIIGTFAGLLSGLGKFDPSTSASAISGLTPLMGGVTHAFVVSALAIGCAMLVTFISRLVLAYLYRLVDELTQAIDSLYRTGAGEEYLARLVQASEKSEAHAAQLKEALVDDMTKMMTNLVEMQIKAQAESNLALGQQIGGVIAESLAGPMQTIADGIRTTAEGNNDAVSGMLETMLAGFMAKLEDTFGGQMRGINEQMANSMGAMTAVQQSLQQLLGDIGRTNETAASQMSGKLEDAMKQAAANQEVLTGQMREFVTEFRKLVTEEQQKSKQVMDDSISKVLEQVSATVERLDQARIASGEVEEQRGVRIADETRQLIGGLSQAMDGSVSKVLEQVNATVAQLEHARIASGQVEDQRGARIADETRQLIGGLSGQVQALLESVAQQVAKTQQNIDALSGTSMRAIDGMNQGALTMSAAAQKFETAGGAVSTVFDRSGKLSEQLTITAAGLQSSAAAVRDGFERYDATRRVADTQVAALTVLAESVKKEAGLSRQIVDDLERIVAQLRSAEGQSLQYLEQVNSALVDAFDHFSNALTKQVKTSITDTDRHLGNGVNQLNGVVQQLAVAMARLQKVD
ncbi:anti-phage ZorAB system protein ZorA [Massilia sp. TWR1-2-2]|uniref:anti-phage ZorAB system protein ZorA n=1 Tax=Massilia sp. TWR1-2-2 TaxID=2804584 RepID=UPI003CF788B2